MPSDGMQWQNSQGKVLLCSSGYVFDPDMTHDEWHEAHPDAAQKALARATAFVTRLSS